jgi:hypothetical protein
VDEELVNRVFFDLGDKLDDNASCNEISDSICANTVLTRIDASEERERIRREIAEAFVVRSWTQRVYFDMRSMIMTLFGAIITLTVFWRVGTVDV